MGHDLRIAVLGHGSIGRRHAALLRNLGAQVITHDPFAPADTDDLDRALSGVDGAVVASPSSEHERQTLACIAAGVSALVEKPLALDSWGAGRVHAAAARAGVPVAVAMNLRHHPGVCGVRDALPRVGESLRAAVWCGSWLPGWRPNSDYRKTYSARRELGGGVLLDAIHEIDELTWLLGPVRSVSAVLMRVSSLEIDVEDVALLQLELASGIPATVTLDYLDRAYHRGCRIVGSEATVHWEWRAGKVEVHGEDGSTLAVTAPEDVSPTYRAELAAFLQALRGGEVAGATTHDARHALQIVDAARVSAQTGCRVGIGAVLRSARPDDADVVLEWRNTPTAIAASLTGTPVVPSQHAGWYRQVLADPERVLWILEDCGRPAGSVRLDLHGDARAEVSIALAEAAQGVGLGRAALRLLATAAPPEVRTIIARVRADNERSLSAFRAADYREVGRAAGIVTLELTR